MNQTNSKLPNGWVSGRLEEIARLNPRHPSDLDPSVVVSFVPMPAVNEKGWKLRSSQKRPLSEVRNGYTHFANGDVIFAKITPCMENGKAGVAEDLVNGLGCGTTELHVIRPCRGIESKFLYYFIHREDFRKVARQSMTGTAGQLRVPLSFIKETEIPIPPAVEQRRIVAKLEKLLAKVDACKERLEKIPTILKRFRQSVLAAACSGRLTTDWRDGLNEWVDSKIGDVVLDLSNGFSKRFGSHGEEVTVLRLSDFSARQRIYGKERQIRLTKEEREKYTLDKGDILVVRVNGSREIAGRFILYDSQQEAYCDHFIRIKVDCNRIQPRFLTYAMDTNSSRVLIENSLVTSAGQNTINQKALSSIPVSLPPLEEQHEIVRRVEALFKIAADIEKRYNKAKAHIDKLTQSILAKAFRGELVPQDPNDEPASELLKRIQGDRRKQV